MRQQVARFAALHPEMAIEVRSAPDEADTRHQLYVQWLNAHARDPDVLQLDVIGPPEFAAAGWMLRSIALRLSPGRSFPRRSPPTRWNGRLLRAAVVHRRRDALLAQRSGATAPTDYATVSRRSLSTRTAIRIRVAGRSLRRARHGVPRAPRGFGGRILDGKGRVVVDSEPAVRALTVHARQIHAERIVPATCSRGRKSTRALRSRMAGRGSCATGPMPCRSCTIRRLRGRGPVRGGADARRPWRDTHGRARRIAARHQRAQPTARPPGR